MIFGGFEKNSVPINIFVELNFNNSFISTIVMYMLLALRLRENIRNIMDNKDMKISLRYLSIRADQMSPTRPEFFPGLGKISRPGF